MADISAILQDESVQARFWSKVDRKTRDECWPWKGSALAKDRRGTLFAHGATITAPRYALALASGAPASDRLFACHSCDNPNCVNPAHLWWGTNADNLKDAGSKGLLANTKKALCPQGHALSGDNLRIVKGNQRRCHACTMAYKERRRARLRSEGRRAP